jgi:hypothetical protein
MNHRKRCKGDNPTLSHPPKPHLTVRVGVTGHRPEKLNGTAVDNVERRISEVFAAIEDIGTKILTENTDFYAQETPIVRLVSGFAEGADQIAVARRLEGWRTEALLPFPRQEFAKDFAESEEGGGSDRTPRLEEALQKADVITELPTPPESRERGYANMGSLLLGQIDVLIAVWDGKRARPGGTGSVVKAAFADGVPVIWISTIEDHPASMLDTFEPDGHPTASGLDCCNGPLRESLIPIFGASRRPHDPSSGVDKPAALLDFLEEKWPRGTLWAAYDLYNRLCSKKWPRLWIGTTPIEKRMHEWDDFIAAAPPAGDLSKRIFEILLLRFIWADTLAIYYANAYRSTYVLGYILSFVAVSIALAGVFVHHEDLDVKAILVGIEFGVVAMIVWIVGSGRKKRRHERWLDYRILAEALRHMRFLAYIGEFGRIRSILPAMVRQSWVLWYIRSTARELGMPCAQLDENYQWNLLNATRTHEVQGQMEHHRVNHEVTERMNHALHVVGNGCFFATLFLLLLFVLCWLIMKVLGHEDGEKMKEWLIAIKPWLIVAGAGLPALGAALSGIRVQGDFEGAGERSKRTVEALHLLSLNFEKAGKTLEFETTSDTLVKAARILSEDLVAWQELYGRKRLTLPA